MICWSCERAASDGTSCSHCNAIQPPKVGLDHFAVLGLPVRYELDLGQTESRFRELSRQVHPDRFAKADPRARRASLQRSVQLNESWRTIKDPVRRGAYLLRLDGYDVGGEEGAAPTDGATNGQRPARGKVAASPTLLAEILEFREDLVEASAAGDEPGVRRMAAAIQNRLDASLQVLAEAFAEAESREAAAAVGRDEAMLRAAQALVAIRYYARFLDEVAVHEESGDRAASLGDQGPVHA